MNSTVSVESHANRRCTFAAAFAAAAPVPDEGLPLLLFLFLSFVVVFVTVAADDAGVAVVLSKFELLGQFFKL